MASRWNFLLALLVCSLVTLGFASVQFHESTTPDAPQALAETEHHSFSSLWSSSENEIRDLVEKFVPGAHLGKRQSSNNNTTTADTSVAQSSSPTSTTAASTTSTSTSTSQTTPTSIVKDTSSSTPVATTPTSTPAQTTAVETKTTTETSNTPTPSQTAASSATSTQGTTLSTQTSSSQDSKTTESSTPSSTLVTATLTSTLPDGGISVVTQTSYSFVDAPEASGSTTTPEASLQTEGAAPKNLLQPAMAAAVGGFWLLRNFV